MGRQLKRRDLLRVTQSLISLSNVFKPLSRRFVIRIFIRVMHDRQSSIRFFDISLGRVPLYAQYLIIVLSLCLLHLQLRRSDLSLNARLGRVRLLHGLIFSKRGLPVPLLGERFGFRLAGLNIGRVEIQSTLAVGNGRFGLG